MGFSSAIWSLFSIRLIYGSLLLCYRIILTHQLSIKLIRLFLIEVTFYCRSLQFKVFVQPITFKLAPVHKVVSSTVASASPQEHNLVSALNSNDRLLKVLSTIHYCLNISICSTLLHGICVVYVLTVNRDEARFML